MNTYPYSKPRCSNLRTNAAVGTFYTFDRLRVMRLLYRTFLVTLIVGFALATVPARAIIEGETPPEASTRQRLLPVPLHFEKNDGQTDPAVKFLSRGKGYALFLTPDEAVLRLRTAPDQRRDSAVPQSAALRMRLMGAKPEPRMTGLAELPGKVNYFRGNDPAKWRTNVSTYAKVKYEQVYPGIDLVFYGNSQEGLEYDFVVAPGGDPNQIKLGFAGADSIEIADDGDLVLQIGDRQIRQRKPRVYQRVNGREQEISGGYAFSEAFGVRRQAQRDAAFVSATQSPLPARRDTRDNLPRAV